MPGARVLEESVWAYEVGRHVDVKKFLGREGAGANPENQ